MPKTSAKILARRTRTPMQRRPTSSTGVRRKSARRRSHKRSNTSRRRSSTRKSRRHRSSRRGRRFRAAADEEVASLNAGPESLNPEGGRQMLTVQERAQQSAVDFAETLGEVTIDDILDDALLTVEEYIRALSTDDKDLYLRLEEGFKRYMSILLNTLPGGHEAFDEKFILESFDQFIREVFEKGNQWHDFRRIKLTITEKRQRKSASAQPNASAPPNQDPLIIAEEDEERATTKEFNANKKQKS